MQDTTRPLSQERMEKFFSLTSPLIGLIERIAEALAMTRKFSAE
jgi:hypothetical protein